MVYQNIVKTLNVFSYMVVKNADYHGKKVTNITN